MDAKNVISNIPIIALEQKDYLSSKYAQYQDACKENREISEKISKLENENLQMERELSSKVFAEILEKRAELEEKALKTLALNSSNFSYNINSAIMGYTLQHEAWSRNHQVALVRFCYNENCYIRIAVSSAGLKDLLEIVPNHPNFLNIRNFLLSKQDIAGLLSSMYKYFKFVEESKCEVSVNQSNGEMVKKN